MNSTRYTRHLEQKQKSCLLTNLWRCFDSPNIFHIRIDVMDTSLLLQLKKTVHGILLLVFFYSQHNMLTTSIYGMRSV